MNTLLLLPLLVFTILFTAVIVPQNSFAATLTVSVPAATTPVYFRNPEILAPGDPVITFDKSIYHLGDAGVLTITDHSANVDRNVAESITATVGSQTITLDETGVDSGIFNGDFTAGVDKTVVYNPTNPPDSIRALLSITAGALTDVTITDFTLPEGTCLGDNIATEGITVSANNPITLEYMSISYANGVIDPLIDPLNLRVVYDSDPSNFAPSNIVTDIFGVSIFSHEFDLDINGDGVIEAVTTDATTAADAGGPTPGTGNYVVVIAGSGCSGGVGGGIKAGGLVFNALAGVVAGNTGTDVTPPSLVFSRPTTGLRFTDALLGSMFAPDPLKPISPTTDSSIVTPLKIGDNGYFLTGYANTLAPQPENAGDDVALTLSFLEASSVRHVALHFVDASTDEMSDTDPMITFDNGNVVKSDPNGVLGDQISFTTSKDGIHSIFNFVFSFDEPTKRHLMITAWDDKRNSANTKIFDAFDVSGASIPNEENHYYLQNLGQFIIGSDGVTSIEEKNKAILQEPVVGFDYPESTGKLDRHDMTLLYTAIDDEQTRASVVANNFNLDKNTFVAEEVKSNDKGRASELTLSNVGHKLRDFTKTPEQNAELLKQICWQEHLRAEKTLKSLLVGSKYHQD